MKSAVLVALLVVGVLLAGAGAWLNTSPFSSAGFGWTAYSPLSTTAYLPGGSWWLAWGPRVGLLALGLGAGTAGAALVALVLRRSRPTA